MNPPAWKIPAAVLASAAGLAVLALGSAWALQSGLAYPCPFKFLFGVPCPTCGSTRSLAALAALDFAGSLRFNPLVLLGGTGALLGWLLHRRHPWLRRAGLPFFLGAVLLNWAYLIVWLPR